MVVFRGEIIGAGVTEANNNGLWYGTDTSDLALLVRAGDTMFVNGQNRTLRALPESDAFSLSETGIAWPAFFTDNTSAIIYSAFESAVAGDYNENGVDAADYTVWRDTLGGATYTQSHYDQWKQNFGATTPLVAAGTNGAVPEPSSCLLATVAVAFVVCRRRA